MADVQSNEASKQAKDTPSSANVEEKKCSATKKQFGATDHVVTIPCNEKSCLSEEETEKRYIEQDIRYKALKKILKKADLEFMFAMFFICICYFIKILFFDLPEAKSNLDKFEFVLKWMFQPMLVYTLLRCIHIIFSFVSYKVFITYHAPTENIDLVEKKYFEGMKKCKESSLVLFCVSIYLIVVFGIAFILVGYFKSTS